MTENIFVLRTNLDLDGYFLKHEHDNHEHSKKPPKDEVKLNMDELLNVFEDFRLIPSPIHNHYSYTEKIIQLSPMQTYPVSSMPFQLCIVLLR